VKTRSDVGGGKLERHGNQRQGTIEKKRGGAEKRGSIRPDTGRRYVKKEAGETVGCWGFGNDGFCENPHTRAVLRGGLRKSHGTT